MTITAEPSGAHEATTQLVRTSTGSRLHIPACPHIVGVAVAPAGRKDVEAMGVCTWCQAELDGVGRTYYESLEKAMRAFGTHVGTESLIRETLRSVGYDQIWVPYSRAYIALGLAGSGVAWIGKTYVMPARDVFVELPGYEGGSGGGTPAEERIGEICGIHYVARGLNGVCDDCD